MSDPTDVIERIDELAADEKCPHCDRAWHERTLTRAVARMFEHGQFDADYFTREDTSPIACEGSSFIGPIRPASWTGLGNGYRSFGIGMVGGQSSAWIAKLYDATWTYLGQMAEGVTLSITPPSGETFLPFWGLGFKQSAPWVIFDEWTEWPKPEPACAGPLPDVDVEFGPQNWLPAQESVHVPASMKVRVMQRWDEFIRPEDIPIPASPGYDFTALQCDEPKYPTSKKGKK